MTLVGTAVAVLFLAVGFVTRPVGVEAGTAVRMDISELATSAELIVEASVLSTASFEVDGRIETEYLMRVDRTFAGSDEPYRSIRIPGGVLENGRGMLLAGMPRIAAGEDVLLFLSEEGATGVRMPIGLAQGKFSVLRSETGETTLRRDMGGVTLVSDTGSLQRVEGATVLEYAAVVAEIEAALASKDSKDAK